MRNLLVQLKQQGIYEIDDFEPLKDELTRKIEQAQVKHNPILQTLDNYSVDELDVKLIEVGETYDNHNEDTINTAMNQLDRTQSLNKKSRIANKIISNIASSGYYGYMFLRKKLNIPYEHPTLKPWYAQFLPQIPGLVNPGGIVALMEGDYTISEQINPNSNTMIEGVGKATKIIQSAADTHSIYADTKDDILIRQLYLYGKGTGSGAGIRFKDCNRCVVERNWIENMPYCGVFLDDGGKYQILNNYCINNPTHDGITAQTVFDGFNVIVGNTCMGNGDDGIDVADSYQDLIAGNVCSNNSDAGISLGAYAQRAVVAGNMSSENEYGILVSGSYNTITGNTCSDMAGAGDKFGIRVSKDHHVISGNNIYGNIVGLNFLSSATKCYASGNNINNNTTQIIDLGSLNSIINNGGTTAIFENKYVVMKNTSGGGLVAGDIITLKAVATGDEITTTATQGDDKVYGMVAETIANDAYGFIQILGKTTALKVNGTTAIAIGDMIGTYTAAGICMKADAGDMAIAMALETYAIADSAGVIDALLITPRKI